MTSYEDIIHLAHHQSTNHPQMSIYDRAAQFSPFAALTGHDEAVKEVARLTEQRIELDESSKEIIDERLQFIRDHITDHPLVEVTYFVPDGKKAGGAYKTIKSKVSKLDEYSHMIMFDLGEKTSIFDIVSIDGSIFE
jgi:hypothetical protein